LNPGSKKVKKKRGNDSEVENHSDVPKETEKQSILSKLNKLDYITKAKTRITEEKIKKGLIKSQPIEEEKVKKNKIVIIEVKKKIEELRDIKQDYFNNGEVVKALEIAEKIISIAKNNNLNLIVNEEKGFIKQVQARAYTKKPLNEQIEELKKKRHEYYTQKKYDEAIQIAEIITELAKNANLFHIIKTEENFINLIRAKSNKKMTRAETIEDLIEETPNLQIKNIDFIEINKFNEERLKFEEEKEIFRRKKMELEAEREKFLNEKQKFEEEKKAFKWEKEMYDEAKKIDRDKFSS
jgi:hypothetical protein